MFARFQVISIFNDYSNALNRAVSLDAKILGAAAAVSTHYADLVSLAARQTMASTELTIGNSEPDGSGQPDPSDIKMFMKNIGSSNTYALFCTPAISLLTRASSDG